MNLITKVHIRHYPNYNLNGKQLRSPKATVFCANCKTSFSATLEDIKNLRRLCTPCETRNIEKKNTT